MRTDVEELRMLEEYLHSLEGEGRTVPSNDTKKSLLEGVKGWKEGENSMS